MLDTERLLATDLDGTLVGHPESLARLVGLLASQQGRWKLIYVTGRSLASARALAAAERLPVPDAWVTDVGTVITYGDGKEDHAWRRRMEEDWCRVQVAQIAMGFAPPLALQPCEGQGPFKVSFFVGPHAASETLPVLQQRLGQADCRVRFVYSSQRNLDILPAAGGKGQAVRYLAEQFGVSLGEVLTCGDSGNDQDMLSLGTPAVAVGNANAELLSRLPESVYRAEGHCAEGILEALEHYRWVPQPTTA